VGGDTSIDASMDVSALVGAICNGLFRRELVDEFHVYEFKTRMASSGMLRRVALVRTDVSEEFSTSFITVTRIGELGTTLTVTGNRCTLRSWLQLALFLVHRFLSRR
jgi:hypothetical protein